MTLDKMNDELVDDVITTDNSYWFNMRNALQTVENKKAYITLIKDGYLKDYVSELLAELIDPYTTSNGLRGKVVEKLVAVARFQDYLDTVMAMGTGSEESDAMVEGLEQEYREKVNTLFDALLNLGEDSNFKKVFSEGYLQEFAVRQTSLLAVERIDRTELLEALVGVSHFQQYLLQVQRNYAELQVQNEGGDE